MNILVNGITLENANLTPLLINCKVWQSKGANITFIGNQTLKHKIIKINLIKNFHFLKLNHTKKITTKTQLITEGLKRNIQAINIIPKIKGKFNIIHSRSSVLDLVIFPFILKIIDNKIKWTTVFDNTVPSGPFLPYLLFQLSLRLLKKADIIFTISPDLKKYLIKKNFNGKKIVITGNAVETDLIKSSTKDPKLNFHAIFVGRLHQANFSRNCRARPAGEQQAGHNGAQFPHQREGHQHPEGLAGTVAFQGVIALQAEHHADEQTGNQDDDDAQRAGEIDFPDRQLEAPERRAGVEQHGEEEMGGETETPEAIGNGVAKADEGVRQAALARRQLWRAATGPTRTGQAVAWLRGGRGAFRFLDISHGACSTVPHRKPGPLDSGRAPGHPPRPR